MHLFVINADNYRMVFVTLKFVNPLLVKVIKNVKHYCNDVATPKSLEFVQNPYPKHTHKSITLQ